MKFSQRQKFLSLIVLSASLCAFGPVAPTGEVMPHTKPTGTSVPDLPYKAHEISDSGGLSDNDILGEQPPPEEVIDWAKMPFVPSKKLELKPAPDPEIE